MGSAVPALGYELAAKYIIHAVVPKWIDGDHGEHDILSSAYVSALDAADVMECKSITFPLWASGQFLEDQLKKGIDYFKDTKNREKAVQFGIGIVKLVMKK